MESSRVAGNLLALLAAIPDPRGRQGRRHPLAAMLAAIVCGILTGARGYRAIAQWARAQHATIGPWLGFQRRPPCANCFRNLLLALDPAVLEAVLCAWMQAVLGKQLPTSLPGVSLDGKTLCNTLSAHERNVQLLSFFDQAVGGVLGQQAVDPTPGRAAHHR